MDVNCIGVNDKKASLPERERYAFSAEEQAQFHRILRETCGCSGSVIVSTCNRSEIYFCGESEAVERAFAEYKGVPKGELMEHIYRYTGESTLRHLFYVAGGLDSMVLGEDEILRQVKEGYLLAHAGGYTCSVLNIAFQGAFACAKDIRTNTLLSKTPVSTGTLAANRIEAFLREHGGSGVLLVGITGKIGSILAKNLWDKGIRDIVGTTRKRAGLVQTFSNREICMVDFAGRYDYVDWADVVVSATTGPHYTFLAARVAEAMTSEKPRLFLDMAVPRDMDAEIGVLPGAELLNIDDFGRMASRNNEIKQKESEAAALILAEHVEETLKRILTTEFLGQNGEAFAAIRECPFGTVFYRLREELTGEQWRALLSALERLVEKDGIFSDVYRVDR